MKPPSLLCMCFLVAVTSHIMLVTPESRTPNNWYKGSGLKSYPCGGTRFTGVRTSVTPGKLTVEWGETVTHTGAPYRLAISVGGDDSFDIILVDHLGHNDQGSASFYSPKMHSVSVDIPDINCPNCVLQLVNPMTDKERGLCDYPSSKNFSKCFSVYHSCADIAIQGQQDPLSYRHPNPTYKAYGKESSVWTQRADRFWTVKIETKTPIDIATDKPIDEAVNQRIEKPTDQPSLNRHTDQPQPTDQPNQASSAETADACDSGVPWSVRSARFPSLCLANQNGRVNLAVCDRTDQSQVFELSAEYKSLKNNDHCLSMSLSGGGAAQVEFTPCVDKDPETKFKVVPRMHKSSVSYLFEMGNRCLAVKSKEALQHSDCNPKVKGHRFILIPVLD